jgi:hypothetical protein
MRVLAALLGSLRRCLDTLPDKRRGANTTYRMVDFGMAAFSVFFMQSPSFLAHQRRLEHGHARSNCQSLFEIRKIPTDNQIREMLDPVAPERLYPVFAEPIAALEGMKEGLESFRRLGGHVLIALDGTEYFSSKKIHCDNCSTRQRGKGEKEYFHAMLGATLVAPGHGKVIPLEPEFITPQDGAEKQDCENAAAKRWLATHGHQYARLNPIYLGDDLFSRQPLCEAVRAIDGHFIFVCKPSSHPLIQEYLAGIALSTHQEIVRRGKSKIVHRYRWIEMSRCAAPRMPCTSIGSRSRSSIPAATSPIATVSSPISRLDQTMSLNWLPAVGPGGKSKMNPSTSSRPRDTTSNITLAMVSSTWPPSLSP